MQVERESSFDETPRSLLGKAKAIRHRLNQIDANSSSILCGINNIKIKLDSSRKQTILLIQDINNVKAKRANKKITFVKGNTNIIQTKLDSLGTLPPPPNEPEIETKCEPIKTSFVTHQIKNFETRKTADNDGSNIKIDETNHSKTVIASNDSIEGTSPSKAGHINSSPTAKSSTLPEPNNGTEVKMSSHSVDDVQMGQPTTNKDVKQKAEVSNSSEREELNAEMSIEKFFSHEDYKMKSPGEKKMNIQSTTISVITTHQYY